MKKQKQIENVLISITLEPTSFANIRYENWQENTADVLTVKNERQNMLSKSKHFRIYKQFFACCQGEYSCDIICVRVCVCVLQQIGTQKRRN
jgi:hypothetical protein